MKIAVCGGSKSFFDFLCKCTGKENVIKYENIETLTKDVSKFEYEAVFLLPEYDIGEHTMEEFSDKVICDIARIVSSGKTKIYIENYQSVDSRDSCIFGLEVFELPSPIGKRSIRLKGSFAENLGFELMQKRNAVFLPSGKCYDGEIEILAEAHNAIGTHKVAIEDERSDGVILSRTANGVYVSMADLTNFDSSYTLPYEHWKLFYAEMYSEIIGVKKETVKDAFSEIYSGIKTEKPAAYKHDKAELAAAFEASVKNAVMWHIDSGIMPNKDGSGGVYEMVRSFNLKIAKNMRGDSNLLTAALFCAAGKYFNNPEWELTAQNIIDSVFYGRSLQITDGENKGLLKWFAGQSGLGSHSVYVSDSGRGGYSLCALYKTTGNPAFKKAAIEVGDALYRMFDGGEYVPCAGFLYDREDIKSIQKSEIRCRGPEFYDAIAVLFKNLYDITGDEKYKTQILKTASAIAKQYPKFGVVTAHSKNFTYSRALAVFAVAQSFESGNWTPVLNNILDYFSELQHETGGFADGFAYYDKSSLKKEMEFAVGIGKGEDEICDIMYCQNTMIYALRMLTKYGKEGYSKDLAEKMFKKSLDFLLNIQIKSDEPKFSGSWMRAYDMELCEYYGCDKDYGWGPYSILTGWVSGIIPLVFLDILGAETMY